MKNKIVHRSSSFVGIALYIAFIIRCLFTPCNRLALLSIRFYNAGKPIERSFVMKSGELARLANVTVRTLRHYRTIGLLPKPARDANGYCNYGAEDYFRLLRIKNLSALGFSLAEIKDYLDHPDTAPDATLDALDAQLQAEIARLEQQRRTIAQLKAARVGADVPPAFADFLALLSREALPTHL
jgi:DNA-binding transcriptional MerR regulator